MEPNSVNFERTGWVKLKGWLFWSERWLVLEGDQLLFYKAKTDTKEQLKISIRPNASVTMEENPQNPFSFNVYSSERKKFTISTNLAEEARLWVQSIKFAMERASQDALSYLPRELLEYIFLFVKVNDLRNAFCASKKLAELGRNDNWWKYRFAFEWPKEPLQELETDIKHLDVNWKWMFFCKINTLKNKETLHLSKFTGLGTYVFPDGRNSNNMNATGTYTGNFLNGKLHGLGIMVRTRAKYVGEWKHGLYEGKGMLITAEGNRYEGDFKNGKQEGSGVYTFPNGATYSGEFQGGKREGMGKLIQWNGANYEGQFKNGRPEGYGVLTFANGDTYQGNFKNARFDGAGLSVSANGDRYEGEFKNGRREGKGVAVHVNGDRYDGQFKNGKRDGIGVVTYANGASYSGRFKNGKRDGKGVLRRSNGDVYKGRFQNGQYEGYGKYNYRNGNKYKGHFRNGKFDGKGELYFGSGAKYEGDFRNGRRTGYGILTYVTGNSYKGEFKNGICNGLGSFHFVNGDRCEGTFKDGAFSGRGIVTLLTIARIYIGEFINGRSESGSCYIMDRDYAKKENPPSITSIVFSVPVLFTTFVTKPPELDLSFATTNFRIFLEPFGNEGESMEILLEKKREKEKQDIMERDENYLIPGECWFLISSAWLQKWRRFIDGSNEVPGPITNLDLMDENKKAKEKLQPVQHYRGVNPSVWKYFVSQYGGGPPICRSEIDIYAPEAPLPKKGTKLVEQPL